MADPRQKTYPVRMATNMSNSQARAIRKWIRAQRPKISEAEGLRRLATYGLADMLSGAGYAKQPTRKRAES